MFQKILAPIDGSTHAAAAAGLSADLATRFDAELLIIHVGAPDDEGHAVLKDGLQHANEAGVRHVETSLESGDPAARILARATDDGADLIVVGSRGLGALDGLVMGSVSHKVFHLAPCSCITVHLGDDQAGFKDIKTILVPTDGSPEADRAVSLASEIAGRYGAGLVLLYAMWRGPSLDQLRASVDTESLSQATWAELDPERHPVAEHISSTVIAPVLSKSAREEIGTQVLERGAQTAKLKGVVDPKLILHDGEPARATLNFARREGADLIVMGSRGLGRAEGMLAGSVSYKVSHSAPCSCMMVR